MNIIHDDGLLGPMGTNLYFVKTNRQVASAAHLKLKAIQSSMEARKERIQKLIEKESTEVTFEKLLEVTRTAGLGCASEELYHPALEQAAIYDLERRFAEKIGFIAEHLAAEVDQRDMHIDEATARWVFVPFDASALDTIRETRRYRPLGGARARAIRSDLHAYMVPQQPNRKLSLLEAISEIEHDAGLDLGELVGAA